MKHISRAMVFILAALLVIQPAFAWAATGARIIPQGNVSLLEDGKEVTQFQSEVPLPEGSLMLCNGKCLVQTQSLQLVAQDRAVFALAEGKARWDLTVKSGQVDFSMRPDGKPVSFHTPLDTVNMERAIIPANTAGTVKGSLKVAENESLLSIQEGSLQVMGPDGTMLIQPGQALRLAAAGQQDDSKKGAAAAGGAAAGTAAGASTMTIAGITATTTTWALVAAGVVAVGVGVGVGVAASGGGDDGGKPVSGK